MLRATQAQPYAFDRIVGESGQMATLKNLLRKVAASPASTVLLTGESGTGKDLAAKVLHYNSNRASRPFMNITCSAIPDALLESELFGHERGAFTDARQQKRGLLESADGGTVFLDEIGEMVPGLQAKLLRFLEEKAFKRVGGSHDIRVDVRVVAATNRNLEDQVKAGRFREDLYYRLNVLPIALPPLRTHLEDVPLLVGFYIDLFNREFRKSVRGASPAALRGAAGVSVARQHPRGAQRRRAGDAPRRRRRGSSRTTFPCWRRSSQAAHGIGAARRRRQSRGPGAQPRDAGPRTLRRQSDQGRRAARAQSRPDSLSDREVRSGQDRVVARLDGRVEGSAGSATAIVVPCGEEASFKNGTIVVSTQ